MKSAHLKLVVVTVCASMLGLIGIQIYWISNAFNLERDRVMRSASEALNEVVDLLERHETLTKLKSHQEAKYLFVQEEDSNEALVFPPDDSLVEYVVNKNMQRSGDRLEMQIVEEHAGKKREKIITHSVDDLPFASDLEEEIELKVRRVDSLSMRLESSTEHYDHQMSEIRNRVKSKRTFLGDIVKSLIEVNINQDIDERIDPRIVDSLLQLALHQRGIHTPFEMGVFDERKNMIFGEEANENDLATSEVAAKLFPNDVIQVPYYLHLQFPNLKGYILKNIWALLAVSLLFVLVLSYIIYYILKTLVRQKKNSEIKNDFINNMTHELKTPISTISLACEALGDPELSRIENVKNRYINIINAENKRLGLLVEEVLQSAVLDKGDFKLKRKDLDIHDMITDVIDKFSIQLKERNGEVQTDFAAEKCLVEADRNHLTNVMYNLFDNALKYSKGDPKITVTTKNEHDQIVIAVKDNGIGISNDNLKKVFDRLYRVPTGNVHNVKGFGLGLSYVKIITERHGGGVAVESQLGQGSTFYIYLPLKIETHGNHREAA